MKENEILSFDNDNVFIVLEKNKTYDLIFTVKATNKTTILHYKTYIEGLDAFYKSKDVYKY